jgi:hypothetical protein
LFFLSHQSSVALGEPLRPERAPEVIQQADREEETALQKSLAGVLGVEAAGKGRFLLPGAI